MPFNPDAYIQEKSGNAFNPDKYLSEKAQAPVATPSPMEAGVSKMMNTPFLQGVKKNTEEATSPEGVQRLAAGSLLPGAASGLAAKVGGGLKGLLQKTGIGAAQGAATGAAYNPDDKLAGAESGALVGGGLTGLGAGISQGGNKLADYLMQRSVGMRKNIPGAGNTLVDEGLWGTKKMMAGQASSKLGKAEGELQELAGQLKGNVSSKDIADAISQHAQKFTLPSSGKTPAFAQGELNKVRDMATDVGNLGDLSAKDLLAMKRMGDWHGYTSAGNPASSLEGELGKTAADASRKGLAKLSEGSDTTVPEILKREQALISAKKALNKPDSIHQGNGSAAFFGKLPGQSILESLGAHAAQGTASAINPDTLQPMLQLLLDKQKK